MATKDFDICNTCMHKLECAMRGSLVPANRIMKLRKLSSNWYIPDLDQEQCFKFKIDYREHIKKKEDFRFGSFDKLI